MPARKELPTHSEESLFDRYLRRGDVDALGEVFDRTAPALLRVAVHLAPDSAAAEDLLQVTFVRAIETASTWNPDRPLLPWLVGILRHQSQQRRWRESRKPDPARLAAATPSGDPMASAESRELTEAVDAAIADLPEVYRTVLRLSLGYGHTPAEIAHALERSPGTVRSQLARGLHLLRRALPMGFAMGTASMVLCDRGLAAVREAVVQHATLLPHVIVAAGSTATASVAKGSVPIGAAPWIGGPLLMKKTLAAVAVIAVLTLGIFGGMSAWSSPNTPEEPTAKSPGAEEIVAADAGAATTPKEQRDELVPRRTETGSALRIVCRFGSEGPPAAGVKVQVVPASFGGSLLARTVTTDRTGTAVATRLPPGKIDVFADRGGSTKADLADTGTTSVVLEIPPGLDVRGRVVDENGTPVSGAHVWLSTSKRRYCEGQGVARTDIEGRFFLRSVEAERFVSAHAPGLRAAIVQPVRGEPGTTVNVELVLQGRGTTLEGIVVDADDKPIEGARLLAGVREDDFAWHPRMFAEYRPPTDVVTDADGKFRVEGLQPGTKLLLWCRAAGSCTWSEMQDLPEHGDAFVSIRLQRGAEVHGIATDAAGNPIAGAFVSAASTAWRNPRLQEFEFPGPGWARVVTRTNAKGRYILNANSPGTLSLRASHGETRARGEMLADDGASLTWNPVLSEGLILAGRVEDSKGKPLVGWSVSGWPPRGKGNFCGSKTDADGRFRWNRCSEVPYRITVYAAGVSSIRPVAIRRDVVPGGEELVVRVDADALPDATIQGSLVFADGTPAVGWKIGVETDDLGNSPIQADVDAESGRFQISPLPSGRYRLQGRFDDRRSAWSKELVLHPGAKLDVGVIEIAEPGSLSVSVRDATGKPLEGVRLAIVESAGPNEHPWGAGKTSSESTRIDNLAPGQYRLRTSRRDLPSVYTPITIKSGEVTDVQVEMPAGVACQLEFSATTEPVPVNLRFTWSRDGTPYETYVNLLEGRGVMKWPRVMLPGRYEVVIRSELGREVSTQFVVSTGNPTPHPVWIVLP